MGKTLNYVSHLADAAASAEATGADGAGMALDTAAEEIVVRARRSHDAGGRLWFIGNGGSAAICSHMANDYTKNGRIRAVTPSDASVLTCLANDFGYEQVYAKALEFQAGPQDGLIAISSSGNSPNIVNAVHTARQMGVWVATFSGFTPANRLRALGDLNIYVRSDNYGTVEVGHLMLLHAILDLSMGWPDIGGKAAR